MDKQKHLSIIIVNYNTCELTSKCIESVRKYLSGKIEYEVICYDNNSSDGSSAYLKSRYPDITLISSSNNIGFGGANNYCFDLVNSGNILLLNSDTYLIDDSLISMIGYLRSRNDIAVVGGKLVYPNGDVQINFGKFPTFMFNNYYSRLIIKYILRTQCCKNPFRVDYVSGAYFLIRKEVLNEVGYFDKRFWMYYEEVDLCRRIKNKGYKIYYYPHSVIVHLENRAFSENQKYIKKKYRDIYYKKYYGRIIAKIISLFDIK